MSQKRLVSPDGRRVILATGEDEIERLEADGYVVPSERRRRAETANSGLEGQRRARASSTTEGQETYTGSTTPGAPANTKAPAIEEDEDSTEDPFDDETAETDADEQVVQKPAADEQKKTEAAAAAKVAQKAAARRPTTR